MAGFRNVPGSGYGNPYIDSLIWGGKVWDQSPQDPILIAIGDVPLDFGNEIDYYAAKNVHGELQSGWLTIRQFRGHWWDEMTNLLVEALSVYTSVANINFATVDDITEANMVWWLYPLDEGLAGWHESPDDSNPSHQRWGLFNSFFSDIWRVKSFGSVGRTTMIHEIGHGLGLAHPHDGGERADGTTFPGVAGPKDIGENGLNQSVYTQMSYNDGLSTAKGDFTYGHQGTLGAFDIAAIQLLYGANMTTATGNDTYTLPTANAPGTGWSSIWDAGGIDTITAAGSTAGVTIDLRAATLQQGDPNAGGFLSQQTKIAGGFTIAKGVVIENAVGSAFDDVLIGNSAVNSLNGGAGNDTYFIQSAQDIIIDSGGVDTVYATFNYANPAIENVIVNGVAVQSGGNPVVGGFRIVRGGVGKDILTGNALDDKIYGGPGKDVLTGGPGKDIFVFDTKPSKANADKVTDYTVADDTIWLDNKVMKKLGKGTASKPGKLSKKFFALDKAKDDNDYVIYVKKSGALLYDEDGSGAMAAVQIATLPTKLKGFSALELFVV
ncbi:M10 family metallopeptidase C-terminal domain-containing protein [Microvirga sp. 2MCAF38]|uniref:M10 family metallopeptidase C-terminal domain-containing protein n=1 Tax=Microvirga sp. 2MCAF38 TaxID=3232989 RepID=UPI003F9AF316